MRSYKSHLLFLNNDDFPRYVIQSNFRTLLWYRILKESQTNLLAALNSHWSHQARILIIILDNISGQWQYGIIRVSS